jgi:hypothetical protein
MPNNNVEPGCTLLRTRARTNERRKASRKQNIEEMKQEIVNENKIEDEKEHLNLIISDYANEKRLEVEIPLQTEEEEKEPNQVYQQEREGVWCFGIKITRKRIIAVGIKIGLVLVGVWGLKKASK